MSKFVAAKMPPAEVEDRGGRPLAYSPTEVEEAAELLQSGDMLILIGRQRCATRKSADGRARRLAGWLAEAGVQVRTFTFAEVDQDQICWWRFAVQRKDESDGNEKAA